MSWSVVTPAATIVVTVLQSSVSVQNAAQRIE